MEANFRFWQLVVCFAGGGLVLLAEARLSRDWHSALAGSPEAVAAMAGDPCRYRPPCPRTDASRSANVLPVPPEDSPGEGQDSSSIELVTHTAPLGSTAPAAEPTAQ